MPRLEPGSQQGQKEYLAMSFSTELEKDQKTEPDPDYRDSQRELVRIRGGGAETASKGALSRRG